MNAKSQNEVVEKKHIFDEFTGKYALSKTLRFELKPVGATLENMRNHICEDGRKNYDPELRTFLLDQNIEDAYQSLKPVFDTIHENFINESLESASVKHIDFSRYFELYKGRDNEKTKDKDFGSEEKKLRSAFDVAYAEIAEIWKNTSGKTEKGKKIFEEKNKGFKILTEAGILEYIRKNADRFSDILSVEDIQKYLKVFEGFFTYFSGFNQNRENYYTTKEEKATAVATRIVHDNLPTFCDNILMFQEKHVEYEKIFVFLRELGDPLVMKNKEKKEVSCVPVDAELFRIEHFSMCLSQSGIDKYNEAIGNANFLINRYNQAQGEKGSKLKFFKTLYKQIGCGKRDAMFFELTDERKKDADRKRAEQPKKKFYSLEELFHDVSKAGKEHFYASGGGDVSNIGTAMSGSLFDLTAYIRLQEDFKGFYWSKAAINTISNRYFANWHDLKDALKKSKVFAKGNGEDEEVKIPEAVDLNKLFSVIDDTVPKNWKEPSVFFRESLTEARAMSLSEDEEKEKKRCVRNKEIIQKSAKPSRALVEMILSDSEEHAKSFVDGVESIKNLSEYNSESSKEMIKSWLDEMLSATQTIKYFVVRPGKIKGESLDSVLSEYLKALLGSGDDATNWFRYYDATRNFLTKKPQDDAKKNKLKLNFENSTLAAGWDANKEKDNSCVILHNDEGKKFLAVMLKGNNTLFEKEYCEGRGKNQKKIKNPLYILNEASSLKKMEYDFLPDVSKMIPKCSTQLKKVVQHFQKSDTDFIFPSGYKVTSGEKFIQEFRIQKKHFELNNRIFLKDDISISKMRYELKSKEEEKKYVKMFQKEYWRLALLNENPEFNEKDLFREWRNFCSKGYNDLSEGERRYKDALVEWINFCKDFISKYPKTLLFKYSFKESSEYNSLNEFYLDVDISSYELNIDSVKINENILNDFILKGKIYLFEIRNQDSNDGKRADHKNNLHTVYWNALFHDIENRPKLNGEAEIFYRAPLSKEKLTMKVDKHGKKIIQNFRFSKEKLVFHVPITLNFCLGDERINDFVNEKIRENAPFRFLGIDRGEKHLAYWSLVDEKGALLGQGSFNSIGGKDYNDLLEVRSKERDTARKDWKTIGTIKELKDGYISQVVRKIVDIAIENGAFIVLEDLNIGFKRGRQKIEKAVYQKLELALAKKLNFLVDKSAKIGEVGSVTKALQLAPPVNNFGDIKKQCGIMLYTRANYTSQTDPLTGWRKTIYLKRGSEENIKKEILERFSDIVFDGKDYAFTYTEKINAKIGKGKNGEKKETRNGKQWTLYSGKNSVSLDRFRGRRDVSKNEWKIEKEDIAKMLDGLFVNFDKTQSLLAQIREGKELVKISTHPAYESLRYVIDLIQQIRNTGKDDNERDADFLFSPVRNANGEHYDSRVFSDKEHNGEKVSLPSSGDANGAYNIARKGIIMAEHIRRGYKPYISDEEWSMWLAGEESWQEWMKENEKDLRWEKKEEK